MPWSKYYWNPIGNAQAEVNKSTRVNKNRWFRGILTHTQKRPKLFHQWADMTSTAFWVTPLFSRRGGRVWWCCSVGTDCGICLPPVGRAWLTCFHLQMGHRLCSVSLPPVGTSFGGVPLLPVGEQTLWHIFTLRIKKHMVPTTTLDGWGPTMWWEKHALNWTDLKTDLKTSYLCLILLCVCLLKW